MDEAAARDLSVALSLQEEEYWHDQVTIETDAALARLLQDSHGDVLQDTAETHYNDVLQDTAEVSAASIPQEEEEELSSNEIKLLFDLRTHEDERVGFAYELVRRILVFEKRLKDQFPSHVNSFDAVGTDDMVFSVVALLDRFHVYKSSGASTRVDIGYHFTREENIGRIRTEGLLTQAERRDKNINAHFNGSSYGDGIYTADGLKYGADGKYGDKGLIVIRLRANEGTRQDPRYDTLVHEACAGRVVVLRSSSQCVAVLEFERSLLMKCEALIPDAKKRIGIIVDRLFTTMSLENSK